MKTYGLQPVLDNKSW